MPKRAPYARSGRLVFAIAGLAVVVVAATGAVLLWRYRQATLEGAADREELLVEGRARQLGDELDALVSEMRRLSQLAEVDLADGNLEPEKTVLRLARRDSAVLSVAVAVLDGHGAVLWAEPRTARPSASGALLVGAARGSGHPVLNVSEGEIAVAAPVAGQGAMVGIVDGRGGRDLFGPALRRSLRESGAVTLVLPSPRGGELVVSSARAGGPPPALRLGFQGQSWLEDGRERWLVTEAAVGGSGLVLRQILSAEEVEGELAAPFHRLLWLVGAALLLATGGGLALAATSTRLERAELELARTQDLAAMGKTAAAIAHEVKNALNGLSVGIDLLAGGRTGAEAAAMIHRRARAEITRLREVADDLTLFAASPRLQLGDLDLAALCGEAADAAAELADDCGVAVRLDVPPAPVVVRGDRPKLLGVLVNLVRNGIEAMGPGAFGEQLGEAGPAREKVLELSARAEGSGAVVVVADRGAGIPPEVRARLFEPFVTTKRTGTGLGLVIVRRVVEAHGGRVTANDRAGGGTSFRVELPGGGAR